MTHTGLLMRSHNIQNANTHGIINDGLLKMKIFIFILFNLINYKKISN